MSICFPLCPRTRILLDAVGMSQTCRFCCKSRKSKNPKNFASVDLWTSLLLHRFSAPLRRFVIDFGSTDMVPHIAARKTHERLQNFSFDAPKRLLQQNLPTEDIRRPHSITSSAPTRRDG